MALPVAQTRKKQPQQIRTLLLQQTTHDMRTMMRGIPAKDACSVYDASSFGVVRSEVQPFHLKKGDRRSTKTTCAYSGFVRPDGGRFCRIPAGRGRVGRLSHWRPDIPEVPIGGREARGRRCKKLPALWRLFLSNEMFYERTSWLCRSRRRAKNSRSKSVHSSSSRPPTICGRMMRGIPGKDACSVYDASSFGVVCSEVQPFHPKKGDRRSTKTTCAYSGFVRPDGGRFCRIPAGRGRVGRLSHWRPDIPEVPIGGREARGRRCKKLPALWWLSFRTRCSTSARRGFAGRADAQKTAAANPYTPPPADHPRYADDDVWYSGQRRMLRVRRLLLWGRTLRSTAFPPEKGRSPQHKNNMCIQRVRPT